MSGPVVDRQFDFTPAGLFPNKETAMQDAKCVIISKLFQEMIPKYDQNTVTQELLVQDAARRYQFLADQNKISLVQADQGAFWHFQRGVNPETAKAYYSFRLSESDAAKWTIKIQ